MGIRHELQVTGCHNDEIFNKSFDAYPFLQGYGMHSAKLNYALEPLEGQSKQAQSFDTMLLTLVSSITAHMIRVFPMAILKLSKVSCTASGAGHPTRDSCESQMRQYLMVIVRSM